MIERRLMHTVSRSVCVVTLRTLLWPCAAHSARNGFVYTIERANGAMVGAKPYVDNVYWTKGICAYSGLADPTSADPTVALHSCVGTRAQV
jgi:glucose dehydrogenase